MRIALLEDDEMLASLLVAWLKLDDHQAQFCTNAIEFLELVKTEPFDLLILDWELPHSSGIEVLEEVRKKLGWEIQILFATQRDTEEDVVQALTKGADDYMAKPLSQAIFLARVAALGRRTQAINAQDYEVTLGPFMLNTQSESVSVNGEKVKLTEKEFRVASCLIQNPGKLVTRNFLLKEVWGYSKGDVNTRTVDVHISKVRKSLGIKPEMGYNIKNIYQHGYRLEKIAHATL